MELVILLPPPPQVQDYTCVAHSVLRIKPRALYVLGQLSYRPLPPALDSHFTLTKHKR
jgi:hypothetical protein